MRRFLGRFWHSLRARADGPGGQAAAHRDIFSGMVWVLVFVFVAKLAGAAKEILIAARYGVGPTVDAYGLIFNVVTWPAAVCITVLTSIVLPLEARLGHANNGPRDQFRRELLGTLLLLVAIITLVLALGLPLVIVHTAAPAVNVIGQPMITGMVWVTAPTLLTTLYSVWIMSGGRHVNSMLEGVTALVLVCTLLLAPPGRPQWLVAGTVLGVMLHLGLAIWVQGRESSPVWPSWRFRSPAWRHLRSDMGIVLLGQVLSSATTMIESFIAAGVGVGAVSTLGYANRLLALFTSLVVLAIGRATLPVFTRIHLSHPQETRAVVGVWLRRLGVLGVLLLLLMWFAAPLLVRLLYERGTFTHEHTMEVAAVLRIGALQLPAYFPGVVLASYAAALRHFRLLFAVGLVTFLVLPVTGWLFSHWFGLTGIALAPTITYTLTLALLLRGLFGGTPVPPPVFGYDGSKQPRNVHAPGDQAATPSAGRRST